MNNRNLTILGVIAALMVIWAVVQSRHERQSVSVSAPSDLIQGLNPDDIGEIVLGTGDKAVRLKRQGDQFVVASQEDYPAENKDIKKLVMDCLDVKSNQLITSNPENHADLGVTKEKASAVIQFLDKDSKPLTGLIIGKSAEDTGGKYVRLIDSDDVYLCSQAPWVRTNALDYVNKELLSVKTSDISQVTVRSDAGSYQITAGSKATPVLSPVPDGKKQKDNDVKQVFNALSSLTFSDFRKDDTGLVFDRTYVCRMKDSTVYTLGVAEKDKKYYITLSADFTDKAPVVKEDRKESEEELKQKEAILLARKAVNDLNNRHKGWIYEIAEWKGKNLAKPLDDLVEDLPKAKEEKAPKVMEQKKTDTPKVPVGAAPAEKTPAQATSPQPAPATP